MNKFEATDANFGVSSTHVRLQLTLAANDVPHGRDRADRVLAEKLAQLPELHGREISRSQLHEWLERGLVRRGSQALRASSKVAVGELIDVDVPPLPPSTAIAQDLPIDELYVDDDIIVLNKSAGMVVHPAAGHPNGTLVNALLYRYGKLADGAANDEGEHAPAYLRPGIVHRLDKDTSGVMIVARTEAARSALTETFAKHDIEREYLAIACGNIAAPTTIETLHGRDPHDRKKFSSRVAMGKTATTHIVPEAHAKGATLVRCRLETGRTHQIRVHLSDRGWPLLGDQLYGRMPQNPSLRALHQSFGRQALHAEVLALRHPTRGTPLRFSAPPPQDFLSVWQTLLAQPDS